MSARGEVRNFLCSERPLTLSHRGRIFAPYDEEHIDPYDENTLGAFENALGIAGIDGFEFDVRLSLDDVPVVFHDDDLSRLGKDGEPLKIREPKLEELKLCILKKGGKIPELREVLELAKARDIPINLEMKKMEMTPELYWAAVDAQLTRVGLAPEMVLLSSFDAELIDYLDRVAVDYPIALLFDSLHCRWREWLNKEPRKVKRFINPRWDMLNMEMLTMQKEIDFGISCWTVNEPTAIDALRRNGVQGIIGDVAHHLRSY